MDTRFLCYKDRHLHISVINAVLYAGSQLGLHLWLMVLLRVKAAAEIGRAVSFLGSLANGGRKCSAMLGQTLIKRKNSLPRSNLGMTKRPGCQINSLSRPVTPNQNFISLLLEAKSNELK